MSTPVESKNPRGNALVIGGGIAGIQCSLDLAESGFFVYLLEKSPTLGGTMAGLDKTFPTNDCSTCMFSPKLVQVAGHPNVEIITGSQLLSLDGEPGSFTALIEKQPRYIDMQKCISCGQCAQKCPKKVADFFNGELGMRKAAFLPFPQAVPQKYLLDPVNCLYLTRKRCGLCKKVCPTQAVDFEQQPETITLGIGAVVLGTGFELALSAQQGEFGFGRYRNVVTSKQYERILSATGPYHGHIRRPSDGRTPRKVAWIQCVLSRDKARNRPFCSSVCCMHAAKQAVMTRSHEPETETTIYFMDIRAHGKGFDDYIDRARHTHGVGYKRSMISQVYLNPENENLIIETFDHHLNRKLEESYDLVVLSSGFQPSSGFQDLARKLGINTNRYGFLATEFDRPVSTNREGIFVCGGMETPKDIPETVIQAGAAAAETSILLASARYSTTTPLTTPEQNPVEETPRIGVFVCHCGSNIAGVVNIQQVLSKVKDLPHVVLATDFMFSCSTETQPEITQKIHAHRLNRIVVAACTPKTHETLFQDTMEKAGLNPYLFEMANIRNQCAWVHADVPEAATTKSVELIRASVARAALLEPLQDSSYDVVPEGLVVGGGIAGMAAALSMADQGFRVHLLEKDMQLGGFANHLTETLEGHSPLRLTRYLSERVTRHKHINLHLNSELSSHEGHIGAFEGRINNKQSIRYGAVVVATGGEPYVPKEYQYGNDERVLTQVEFARKIKENPAWAARREKIVMIQCVGSRTPEFPFCSRVCCAAAVKNSLALKALNPNAQIIVLYRDVRTFGFKEVYYLKAREKGVMFFRYIPEDKPEVYRDNGQLVVDFSDRSSQQDFRVEPDLVILSSGIRPHTASRPIAKLLKLPRVEEGFFLEAHVKLRPVDFATPGVFMAGLAHSPRFIKESVIMAKSAGQQAVKILSKEKMRTSAAIAEVDPKRCAACLVCVRECPFKAPYITAEGVSYIPPSDCRGCGICICECPAQAITLKHNRDDQMIAKIDALVEAALENSEAR